jgi:hypothetical protein
MRPYVMMTSTSKKITAYELIVRIMMITQTYGRQDAKLIAQDTEWLTLVSILQHNNEVSTVINRRRYSLGGVTSGRENSKHGLIASLTQKQWQSIEYYHTSTGDVCTDCGMSIGLDTRYTNADGTVSLLPSLSFSHGIPQIYGGSVTVNNVMLECARCNKHASQKFDRNVIDWLKATKFTVYK